MWLFAFLSAVMCLNIITELEFAPFPRGSYFVKKCFVSKYYRKVNFSVYTPERHMGEWM
jgi:hypothetical protein